MPHPVLGNDLKMRIVIRDPLRTLYSCLIPTSTWQGGGSQCFKAPVHCSTVPKVARLEGQLRSWEQAVGSARVVGARRTPRTPLQYCTHHVKRGRLDQLAQMAGGRILSQSFDFENWTQTNMGLMTCVVMMS